MTLGAYIDGVLRVELTLEPFVGGQPGRRRVLAASGALLHAMPVHGAAHADHHVARVVG